MIGKYCILEAAGGFKENKEEFYSVSIVMKNLSYLDPSTTKSQYGEKVSEPCKFKSKEKKN